jgi:hypothetical protein
LDDARCSHEGSWVRNHDGRGAHDRESDEACAYGPPIGH